MKNLIVMVSSALFLLGCAPSAQQLKSAIEKDPSIVFIAIEKDPEKFIEVVNSAAQNAQRKAQEKAMQEETVKRDEEFKNPLQAEIQPDRVIFGNKDAVITIVEYSDFECPYCSRGYQTVKQVMKEYGDKVRVVFKHLPLDFHPKAMVASRYFEAIAKQGHDKAEKLHDIIFQEQQKFKAEGEKFLEDAAKRVGANMGQLKKDLNDPSVQARIDADMAEASRFNFTGTPGFLINGVSLRGAYPFPEFKAIIDRHLAK